MTLTEWYLCWLTGAVLWLAFEHTSFSVYYYFQHRKKKVKELEAEEREKHAHINEEKWRLLFEKLTSAMDLADKSWRGLTEELKRFNDDNIEPDDPVSIALDENGNIVTTKVKKKDE